MPQIDWFNLIIGWLIGTVLGSIPTVIRWIRERDITLHNSNLSIRRPKGFVEILEPADQAIVGDQVIVKGKVLDNQGKPLTTADIALLLRPIDADEWYPRPMASIYPEPDGSWKAKVTVPKSASRELQVLGLAISPKSGSKLRRRPTVHLTERPREHSKIARLHLYNAPEKSWPVSRAVVSRTDWVLPEVKHFIERSDVDLFSIDMGLVSWFCPNFGSDWGWKNDRDIPLQFDPELVDYELSEPLKKLSEVYRQQQADKKDSVRYCVVEFIGEPRDSGGRLFLRVKPVTYLTAYAKTQALNQPLPSGVADSLRNDFFSKLEERSRPLVPNLLVAHILVVSNDNQLLLQRRRADRALDYDHNRGRWSASLEEHLNAPWRGYLSEDKLFARAHVTDNTIFEGLRRAIREELLLSEPEVERTELCVLAAGFEYDTLNTVLYAMAELPQSLTAERLGRRLKSGEEHDRIAWCPFDMRTLKPTLVDSSPPINLQQEGAMKPGDWKWVSTSRMRILLGLRRRYGEDELQRWLEF